MSILVVAVQVPPEINPRIGVVIDGNYLSSPPRKEINWIGVGHPTSPQSAHRICPTLLGRILNPVKRNVNSRAQSSNTLEEKCAQYATEPEVSHSARLTLTELMFHVAP